MQRKVEAHENGEATYLGSESRDHESRVGCLKKFTECEVKSFDVKY